MRGLSRRLTTSVQQTSTEFTALLSTPCNAGARCVLAKDLMFETGLLRELKNKVQSQVREPGNTLPQREAPQEAAVVG